jgi:ribosomal silencing factor RsfS
MSEQRTWADSFVLCHGTSCIEVDTLGEAATAKVEDSSPQVLTFFYDGDKGAMP